MWVIHQSWVKTGKSCALCNTSLTLSLFTPPIFCLQLRQTRTQTSSVAIPVPNLEKFPGYLNVLFSCVANSQERQEVVNLEVSSATPTSKLSKLLAGTPPLPHLALLFFFPPWKLRCCVPHGSMRSPHCTPRSSSLGDQRVLPFPERRYSDLE